LCSLMRHTPQPRLPQTLPCTQHHINHRRRTPGSAHPRHINAQQRRVHDSIQPIGALGIIPPTPPSPATIPPTPCMRIRRHTRHREQMPHIVSCCLPQDHAEHAKACSALTTLPLLYPDHLLILGGDFQGDLTSPSDKSCHLRTIPYSRLQGPALPTYTPTHQPEQSTCIDSFCIHDPHITTTQTHGTQNITHVFLGHYGVKATIRTPLPRSNPPTATPTTTNKEHTHTQPDSNFPSHSPC